MEVTQTSLAGVLLITPDIYRDSRGAFWETWNQARMGGGRPSWKLDTRQLFPFKKERGPSIHYQVIQPQGKLVRVSLGAALDLAVDLRRSTPTEPETARAVNARAPAILAEEAQRLGALLVHYSTDYVFNGSKADPWTETDSPNPLNVYGASTLDGQKAIQKVGGRYLIFRTSWVCGPRGNNFLLIMLRLGRERDRLNIVDERFGAPTTSIELANATRSIVDRVLARRFGADSDWSGLYHMTCSGSVSWMERRDTARLPITSSKAVSQGDSLTPNPACSFSFDRTEFFRRFAAVG